MSLHRGQEAQPQSSGFSAATAIPATINAANASRTEEEEEEQIREREQRKTEERAAEKRNKGDRREGKRTAAAYTTTPAASAAASVATAPGNFLPSPVVFSLQLHLHAERLRSAANED